MKTVLMLRAATMVLTLGIGSAYAGDGDGQSAPPLAASMQAQHQQHSASDAALQTRPLFTIGGVQVRVWAPVAPSYNAGTNGDLAARDIWGAG
jgi:hypothetical protein